MKAIEFFAGIGGLHTALKVSDPESTVTTAYDINPNASLVYLHNYPEVNYVQKDIKGIKAETLDKEGADIWLMSPPCQPHTRNGLQKGEDDARSCGFLHIIELLKKIEKKPKYILLENVEGFEVSGSHDQFIDALTECKYNYQEFILSPNQFHIPNQRDRYFIIARFEPFKPLPEGVRIENELLRQIPNDANCDCIVYKNGTAEMGTKESEELWEQLNHHCKPIRSFLDDLTICPYDHSLAVDDVQLHKNSSNMDIVDFDSKHTCCFTKSYRIYRNGTGSILQTIPEPHTHPIPRDYNTLKSLHLRYFSANEMKRIHGFPETFTFPEQLTEKQKAKLVGNISFILF